MNTSNKSVQFELWQECNNHCVYCTLGRNNIKTPDEMKMEALDKAIKFVKSAEDIDVFGLIGGEFFQGQITTLEMKWKFEELIYLIYSAMSSNRINHFWLNATLTDESQHPLPKLLDTFLGEENNIFLPNVMDRVWILTSYDTMGRFHTPKYLTNWKNNMRKLHETYPDLNFNTTMIITGDFIQKYMKNEIDLQEFQYLYNTSIFLKTPVRPDDMTNLSKDEINRRFKYEFFPRKKEFTQFLMKYKEKEGDEAFANLFSNELKANVVHKNYNREDLRDITFTRGVDFKESLDCDKSIKEIETSACGHSNIYKCFVDCDNCAVCTKEAIANL